MHELEYYSKKFVISPYSVVKFNPPPFRALISSKLPAPKKDQKKTLQFLTALAYETKHNINITLGGAKNE